MAGKLSVGALQNTITLGGTIVRVYPDRFTCDVVADHNDAYFSDVPLCSAYLSYSGHGSYVMPEVDSRVVLLRTSDSASWRILGFTLGEDHVEDAVTTDEYLPNYRAGRPSAAEGDQVVASTQGGGHIIVRRSGVVEIGASPAAKRLIIPLGNVIRDLAESYQLHTSAGFLQLVNDRRVDGSDTRTQVPTLLQMYVRQYSDEAPKVRLDAGYVGEVSDRKLPGEVRPGQIVWRLRIGDTADPRQEAGDYSATYEERIGTDGTAHVRTDGAQLFEVDRSFVVGAGGVEVYSSMGSVWHTEGSHEHIVEGRETHTVFGDRDVTVQGGLTERVLGGKGEFIQGTYARRSGVEVRSVDGFQRDQVGGDRALITLGSRVEEVGAASTTAVGGIFDLMVKNGDSEAQGGRIHVHQGSFVLRGASGVLDAQAGGSDDSPAARMELDPSAELRLRWANGSGKLTGVSGSGELTISNPSGLLRLTSMGKVHVGPGPAGYVLTTLTHPVCPVTGSPTMGADGMAVAGLPMVSTGPPAVVAGDV